MQPETLQAIKEIESSRYASRSTLNPVFSEQDLKNKQDEADTVLNILFKKKDKERLSEQREKAVEDPDEPAPAFELVVFEYASALAAVDGLIDIYDMMIEGNISVLLGKKKIEEVRSEVKLAEKHSEPMDIHHTVDVWQRKILELYHNKRDNEFETAVQGLLEKEAGVGFETVEMAFLKRFCHSFHWMIMSAKIEGLKKRALSPTEGVS